MNNIRKWKITASVALALGLLFPSAASAQTFSDVPKTLWTHDIIMEMTELGIIKGYGNGKFGPKDTITRGQAAAMLARSMELKPIRKAKAFKDVSTSNRYYEDIMELYRAGVVDGMSAEIYGVNQKLTRAQMAKVIVSTYQLQLVTTANLNDMTGHWAEEYVRAMYHHGITVGDGTGNYGPNKPLERQHFAVFMYRAMNLHDEPVEPTDPDETVLEFDHQSDLGWFQEQLDSFVYDVTKVQQSDGTATVHVNVNLEGRQVDLKAYTDFGQTMQKLVMEHNTGIETVHVVLYVDSNVPTHLIDETHIYYN